jgi:phage tail-like protein
LIIQESTMATGERIDPYASFNFLVEIDGIVRAAFQEVSGLDSTIEVIEHREGGRNITAQKYPGQVKYSNISLKWGMAEDSDLYDWHRKWVTGDQAAKRKNGSIVVLDRKGEEKARWNFFDAWPATWNGPTFNAEGNDIAIETLELAHEGLVRA